MESSRFEVFKQASKIATQPPTTEEIILAIFLILGFILFFIVIPIFIFRKYKEYISKKTFYQLAANNYGLEPEEIDFLWKLSREFNIEPSLLVTSYATFQKTIFKYIKKFGAQNLDLINKIRSKLGFNKLPEFVPISTTMDIDLYQPVTVIIGDEHYEGAVFENNEQYWAVLFIKAEPRHLHPGEEVIVSFIRPNDGRYIITTKVLDVTRQQGQLVAKLEHTDKLEKIQLRAYVRWPVNIPCKFAHFPLKYISSGKSLEEIISKLEFHDGIIKDISVGGIKLCVEEAEEKLKKIKEGSYILVSFYLNDTPFENIICEVVRTIKNPFSKGLCYGCSFVDLPKQYQQKIQQFIWEEQRKIIKLYKEGVS
ncbi:MAG TPA: PilZ domain-containing protein [Aquifex aeolicus]|nr:PilZ domain-containing protein [Aquifex aeolicus]